MVRDFPLEKSIFPCPLFTVWWPILPGTSSTESNDPRAVIPLAHSKKDTADTIRRCDSQGWKTALRTPSGGLSLVAVLHDYTASAALLWCVGVLSFRHRAPDAGDHVVPGAVAVGDDAVGPS
jgi:hypothetical protein